MSRNPGSGILIGQPLRTGVLCTLPSRRARCPYRGPDAHVSWHQLDSGVQSTEDTSLDAGKRTEYIRTLGEDKLKIRGRDALLVCPWFRLLAHYRHEQGRHSDTRCNNSQASAATAAVRPKELALAPRTQYLAWIMPSCHPALLFPSENFLSYK